MSVQDRELAISNPRLISAVYFGVLAIIATVIIDFSFNALGVERMIPTFKAVLLAAIVAACFGALFGKKIINSPEPYHLKSFLWGFFMVLVALPIYDLIFLYLFKGHHAENFVGATPSELGVTYLFILLYSFILAGIWLAIAAGLAALYLRSHLIYDILHSEYNRPKAKDSITIQDSNPEKPPGIHTD